MLKINPELHDAYEIGFDCNLRVTVGELRKILQEIADLQSFKVAYTEWSDKTEWIQETAHWSELGKHRADVIRARFQKLEAENAELRQQVKPC